jgi:hypothetical protein
MWSVISQFFLIAIAAYFSIMGCASLGKPAVNTQWLPGDGEAKRGQATFKEMGCFTCHAVADPEIPPPVSGLSLRAPLNARIRSKPAHELAAAIINPLHLSVEDKETTAPGDYADVLTVQQLTDLVMYLKEIPGN